MKFDSPIEEMLWEGLVGPLGCQAGRSNLAVNRPTAFVFRQHQIGRYRVDFLVVAAGLDCGEDYKLVIECDGWEFHSGREQLLRDRQREDEIRTLGYKDIIRFSGAEIYSSLFDYCLPLVQRRLEWVGVNCEPPLFWHFSSGGVLDGNIERDRRKRRERYWRELGERHLVDAWRDGEPDDRELYGEDAE